MSDLPNLIQKYNRPAPRYTSYPPVPYWESKPLEIQWLTHVQENYNPSTGLDLYVHIPFCEKLCYYCGCTRIITKDHSVEAGFIDLLLREWELYSLKLGFIPKINSLHFGGGTPTFLSPENLNRLIETLLVNRSHDFIGSIEIDPRTCKQEHLEVLSKNGIKRVSLGIQDFDHDVQTVINRHQPKKMVRDLVEQLRTSGMSSINFDLVYGLPKQSMKSITETIEEVVTMKPDLIAFYSYAHLPSKIKNQRLIPEHDLPSPEAKRELYETGKRLLLESGYVDVGMDHFALPTSYLYKAKIEGNLHRNFMGYVDKKSSILLGLGPTSISDSSKSFAQNAKDLHEYEAKIKASELPFDKGHVHSEKDLLIQEIILNLMCNNSTDLDLSVLPYAQDILKELHDFESDGIISLNERELKITETGSPFTRNVALSFDYRFREKAPPVKFSQTI